MRIVGNRYKDQHSGVRGDSMKHSLFVTAAAMLVASCAHTGDDAQRAAASEDVNGELAYAENCAGCHETGLLNAPRAGDH